MSAVALPCPFCGERKELRVIRTRLAVCYYECTKCNARGPDVLDNTEGGENHALTWWNERSRWWNNQIATTAQTEARMFTDRGLMETIYIILRSQTIAARGDTLDFPPHDTP